MQKISRGGIKMKSSNKKKTFTNILSISVALISAFSITLAPSITSGAKARYGRSASESSKRQKGKTVRKQANRKNLDWDISLKKRVYKNQLKALKRKKIRVDNNRAMVARLRRILGRLKKKSLIPELPYEVHYVDHKTVNAVCYPGGGILFFKGIFDPKKGLINRKSDHEIAAVMAHEIAHATLRHAYRKQKSRQTAGILGSIASIAIGSTAGGDWNKLFNTVFDAGTGLYFPSYSRKQESEADLEGMFTMIAAGYKPESAVAIWDRASKRKGSKTSVYSTHPGSAKRTKKLNQHMNNIIASRAK